MRKVPFLAAYAAVLLFSSLSVAGVNFTLTSPSNDLVTIGYTASQDAGIRGIALNVALSDNATADFSNIISTHPAANASIDQPFPYSPLMGLPTSTFSLNIGFLNQAASAVMDNLITFRIQNGGAGFSWVTLSSNTLRGGPVVGDNIGTVTLPQPLLVTIPEPATMLLLGLGGLMLRRKK